VSMRERASQFGGTLRVDTSPGEGTVITAEIPLTEKNVHE
jgi:signal transduction histidine kinase